MAQLPHLTLEGLDPLLFLACRPCAKALVALRLPHPAPKCLARAPDLLRDRADCRVSRPVLIRVVENHPHRAGTDLRRSREMAHVPFIRFSRPRNREYEARRLKRRFAAVSRAYERA